MGQDERRQLYRSFGFLSTIGINMVVATCIGLAMGYYLDKWLQTSPWCTLLFLVCGIIAGFKNVFILTRREQQRMERIEEQAKRDDDRG